MGHLIWPCHCFHINSLHVRIVQDRLIEATSEETRHKTRTGIEILRSTRCDVFRN